MAIDSIATSLESSEGSSADEHSGQHSPLGKQPGTKCYGTRMSAVMKRHRDDWDDMSNFVVHFTKGGDAGNDYDSMLSILWSGTLKAEGEFGIGRGKAPAHATQYAVCFSEIPPGQWDRLVQRRMTKYGIGFSKELIVSRSGGPVWYAYKETPYGRTLRIMMSAADGDANAPIWRLTPLIDSPGTYGARDYFFEWEREWRHPGSMSFSPEEVSFLLIPEELHGAARSFFEDAGRENCGPGYLCPYIDPHWSKAQIMRALNGERLMWR